MPIVYVTSEPVSFCTKCCSSSSSSDTPCDGPICVSGGGTAGANGIYNYAGDCVWEHEDDSDYTISYIASTGDPTKLIHHIHHPVSGILYIGDENDEFETDECPCPDITTYIVSAGTAPVPTVSQDLSGCDDDPPATCDNPDWCEPCCFSENCQLEVSWDVTNMDCADCVTMLGTGSYTLDYLGSGVWCYAEGGQDCSVNFDPNETGIYVEVTKTCTTDTWSAYIAEATASTEVCEVTFLNRTGDCCGYDGTGTTLADPTHDGDCDTGFEVINADLTIVVTNNPCCRDLEGETEDCIEGTDTDCEGDCADAP